MRRLALLVFFAFAAYLLWVFVGPVVEQARRYAALVGAPVPTALPHPLPTHLLPNRGLTDTWGAARSGGRRHEGIDLFAPRGTPIRATTEGLVLNVGSNTLGGRTVMILGPGGQRHYYAHLERYAEGLERGNWVERGQTVGYVGDSGNARGTPPHLHYGIYTSGGAINPYPLLRAGQAE